MAKLRVELTLRHEGGTDTFTEVHYPLGVDIAKVKAWGRRLVSWWNETANTGERKRELVEVYAVYEAGLLKTPRAKTSLQRVQIRR